MYDYKYSWNENEERGANPLLSRNCKRNESQLDHCSDVASGWEGWQVGCLKPGDRSFQKNFGEKEKNMLKKIIATVFVVLWHRLAFAAHPLITDDTGTQGKGNIQVEVNGEYGNETYGVDGEENLTGVATTISYGVKDNIDMILGIPYQYIRTKTAFTEDTYADTTTEDGISDISIELKWRLFEQDGIRLALKPGITFPTGSHKRGLGSGRAGYSLNLLTTKEIEPFAFHLDLGYIRNKSKDDERRDIWHASIASEYEIIEDFKLVANIGMEKNPDKSSNIDPAFILAGIIYSITENLDVDFGIKAGLNKVETDYSILAGIAIRF